MYNRKDWIKYNTLLMAHIIDRLKLEIDIGEKRIKDELNLQLSDTVVWNWLEKLMSG